MNSIQPHTLNDSLRGTFQTKKWGNLDQVQMGGGGGKKITSLSLEKFKIGWRRAQEKPQIHQPGPIQVDPTLKSLTYP